MAGRISVECPGCLAKVTLPDESKLGKKVKCPKCSDIFVAEAAEEEESDEVEDEAPARSKGRKRPAAAAASAKGGKGKKGPSKSGGGSNGAMIAVGGGTAVVVAGVVMWLMGVFSSPPAAAPPVAEPQPVAAAPVVAHTPPPAPPAPPAVSPSERILALRWLPSETEAIVHAKVSDIWQAPLLKDLVNSPTAAGPLKQFETELGIQPVDIESVTAGFSDSAAPSSIVHRAMGITGQPPNAVVVVRTKKPLSLDIFLKNEKEVRPAEYKSKRYFELTNAEYSGWLADPTTLIMAKSDDLQKIMDRGETSTPRKTWMFADATPQLVIISAPNNPRERVMNTLPAQYASLQNTLQESLMAASLGISIRGGIDLQFATLMKDSQGATSIKSSAEMGLADARKAFDFYKMSAPPLLAELGEQLLNNVKVETQGDVAKVTTNLPDSMQQKIEQVPPLVMMMAMTGGLGGPGASPFGGPPKTLGSIGESPGLNPVFGGMSPGQTDPVEAQSVDGLLEGTTLTAMTAWSIHPSLDPALKGLHPMEVILDLKGDDLHEICGYGQVSLKSVTLAEGGAMKVSKAQSLMYSNAVKVIIPHDPEARTLDSSPDGTIRLHVLVDQPADSAKQIATLEGTFKLLTSEDMEEFTIEEAPKLAKRPLTDPVLKAAGVKLLKTNESQGEALTMSCAKGFFIGRLEAVDEESQDPAGDTMSSRSEIEKNQLVQKVVWQDPNKGNKLPAKLSLKGKIYKGVNEKTVSFKFANIPLPKPEHRPGQAQGNMPQQPNGMP